ncbi:MAG: hypothetical protein NWP87_02005 [Winogradskyella sp.]|nr:hypothetical protein [Winogradskyella sp.]
MKYLRSIIILAVLAVFSQNISAQTNEVTISKNVKPFRLGVKIGVPTIATINAEYLTPLLDDRVAISVDYMSLSPTIEDIEISYNNFEIGANIYLNNKGSGLYAGFSYFSFGGEGSFLDTEFDDGTTGDGVGDIEFTTINLKLGVKFGRTLYTRIEVGYGFGDIPEVIEVTSEDGNSNTFEDIPDIPGLTTSGLFTANIGFGIQF